MVACNTKDEVHDFWNRLAEGGTGLMPLGPYPFSELYGWAQDRYGLSWQVGYVGDQEIGQRITPTLMFTGDVCGRAEEAIEFYTTVFGDSASGDIHRYGLHEDPDREGTVRYADCTLEGQQFAAMDSARAHQFGFNEAISFIVECESQQEIDHYWNRPTAVPEAEQCGWLKDKLGVSWQILPSRLDEVMRDSSEDELARVTQAFLQMKKFDLAELEKAYRGA